MHTEAFLERLKNPTANGDGWRAQCPVNPEHQLTVKTRADDAIVLNCAGGCTAELICQAIKLSVSELEPPDARLLFALEKRIGTEALDELLKQRFLCRGGGMLFVAPTGVGKSTAVMQMHICWALGRECFGIKPNGSLKSLLIQAENDDEDLIEMRDGIVAGMKLTAEDVAKVKVNVLIYSESAKTGQQLIALAERLLKKHKPDLLTLDPALSYLGGDASAQKDVGPFLRNRLTPLLQRHRCGCIIVHHCNKPIAGRDKASWQAGDFAYLGAGSAEWANWARAVMAICNIGSHTEFELRAAKRGKRLGWKQRDGSPSFVRYIAHAADGHYWREIDEPEAKKGGRPTSYTTDDLVGLLKDGGLTTTEWKNLAETELGIKQRQFYTLKKRLVTEWRVTQPKGEKKWQVMTLDIEELQ